MMNWMKSWRSSFDKLLLIFFFIIYNFFHIAIQLYEHSSSSRTIASSQHHPRETRPLLSQPNLYKKTFIGFADFEFASYIRRKIFNRFADSFSCIYLKLFFYAFIFIYNMKVSPSICWFFCLPSPLTLFSFLSSAFIFIYNTKPSPSIC